MTPSVPSGTDQSMRARPPAVVSPETPALATATSKPLGLQRRLQLFRKAVARRQLVARHQAVAEADDLDRSGISRQPEAKSERRNDGELKRGNFKTHARIP